MLLPPLCLCVAFDTLTLIEAFLPLKAHTVSCRLWEQQQAALEQHATNLENELGRLQHAAARDRVLVQEELQSTVRDTLRPRIPLELGANVYCGIGREGEVVSGSCRMKAG